MKESDLHRYQNKCEQHILKNTHCGLFLDMGLGKTVASLTAIDYLMYKELEIESVLIIAPKRVVESVWDFECRKWDHINHFKISKIIGNPKERRKALNKKADLYLLGRDNVAWLCGEFGGSMLPFDMLIIDESSSFKNHKSLRFKSLKMVQPSFKRVVILTGTPAPNGLVDLWSQIYMLDRGKRLGGTISDYKRRYFRNVSNNNQYDILRIANKKYENEIHKLIGDICISMKAEDYITLPKRIDNYINIDLPDYLRKKYDDFEEEQVLELLSSEDGITALSAAALSNKLLQFTNGAIYDADRIYHEIHDLKLDALEEIVEGANGNPIIVAYSYIHDVKRIMKRLSKYKPKKLDGDKDIRDWNQGKIKVLVMHPASGGHGLNLQAGGSTIVWFGLNWSLELYMQLNARLHRQGQLKPVIIHHLIINKTIDIDVKRSLYRKDLKQDGLMKAVKARMDKYRSSFEKYKELS